MDNHRTHTRHLVTLVLLLVACAPLPMATRPEGSPVAAKVSVERCIGWRDAQRAWAITGATASSIAGVGGLASVVMPRTSEAATIGIGLAIVGASALAAGSGVAVTYLSADYAAAGCAEAWEP